MHLPRYSLPISIVAVLLAATAYSVLVVWVSRNWPARYASSLLLNVHDSTEDEAVITTRKPVEWTETWIAASAYTILAGAALAFVGRSGPMVRGAGFALFVVGTLVWAFFLMSAETHRAVDRAYWLRLLAVPASLAVAAMQVGEALAIRSDGPSKEWHRLWAAIILSAWALVWVVLFAPGGSAHEVFGDLVPVQFGLMLLIRLHGVMGKLALTTTPAWLTAIPASLAWVLGWFTNVIDGLFS